MNHCILMAEIVETPQLRYTSDNQTPIAEFKVKIAGLRPDDSCGNIWRRAAVIKEHPLLSIKQLVNLG